MLQLLVADPLQRLDQVLQLGIRLDALALFLHRAPPRQQLPHLAVVMGANLRLDRLRAGHGRFPAQHRRAPAQGGGGHFPHRVHGRGPHAVARQQRVEGGQVAGFLRVHVLHHGPQVRVCFDDGRGLCSVDERGRELAGLIDSELEPGGGGVS